MHIYVCIYIYIYIYILGVFWEYIADRQGHGTTTMGCKYIVSNLFYALTTTPGCGAFPMRTAQANCAGLSPPKGYQKPSTRMLRTCLQGRNITKTTHSTRGSRPGLSMQGLEGWLLLAQLQPLLWCKNNNNEDHGRTVPTLGVPEPTLNESIANML